MVAEVRTITPDELHPWSVAARRGFLVASEVDDSEQRRAFLALERTWGAFDDDHIVATLRSFPVELTLPGAFQVAASAVTQVTTTTTHRRQGLAGQLVLADLAASRERGESMSILIAAEWPIYGRWGYGPATEVQSLTVDTGRTRVERAACATVELVDVRAFRAAAAKLYDHIRVCQVGEISRPGWLWDIELGILQLPAKPEVLPAFHLLVRDSHGELSGAVRYRVETTWEAMVPAATLTADILLSAGTETTTALWTYLLSVDLVTEVKVSDRPVDEILPWLLSDPRRARVSDRHDFLWCRVLDVPAVLSARRYRGQGDLILEITDPQGIATGRYELSGGPDGADCMPTTRSADLTMPVGTLGAVVLGGYSLRQLARAGRADEHRSGVLDTADLVFSTVAPPWCSTWF
ncbi:MAG: GNAT family N-acetyltransferase [Geodermatophilaceae bacterium]|nr:GNAT family N-acetyltransferase [Geodermatophilaceae bacterium]